MIQDKPLFGMLLMLGFCLLAPLGDAFAKLLGETIPLLQILIVRFAMQLILLIPVIWLANIKIQMSRQVIGWVVVRTFLHIISIGAMFISLRYLPLADAVAIAFVLPLLMLVLGKYFLNEEIGPRRIIACSIGFIGALLIIQPSFANVGAPALYPLIVAVGYALYLLVTRKIAKQADPVSLQALSGLVATIFLAVVYTLTRDSTLPDLHLIGPNTQELALLAAIGFIGTFAHLLMTLALRFAPSATLAPMQYLEIPVATLFGLIIFSDLPNGLATLGIVITISAGLYIVLRERQVIQSVAAGSETV
ncbi:MAG: DMT family transporter [Hyphomicrobiales bacterium]|nr:DMT family transporter [Hyphomicrobiales bacterium]